jgi:hypothetical protein
MPGRGHGRAPAACSGEHGRAIIDAGHLGAWWIVSAVPARADAGIQQTAAEILKQQRPESAVASSLERQVKQVIERRNALVAI